ncbi:MAG: putative porin [Planctomycetota bacterium]|jgi:hypothetical protein
MARIRTSVLAVLVFAAPVPAAHAQTPADMQATLKELKAELARQANRISRLEQKIRDEQARRQREQDIRRILKEIREDAAARCPTWLENLTFAGDMRLRYQTECFNRDRTERNIGRFRLRFGFRWTCMEDQMEIVFRLASGEDSRPTSANQTFTDQFDKKEVWIDLAYAKYSPKWLEGVTLMGGKMKNPLAHTDMIWDTDVNPEGVWLGYVSPVKIGPIEPFASIGLWILQHNRDRGDAVLHLYQAGFNWEIIKGVKWTPAITYYDFGNIEENFDVIGARGNSEAGGRLLAEEFNVFNVLNTIKFRLFDLPVSVYFDYAHNCGNEFGGQSDAYATAIKIGRNEQKGDWSIKYKYAYIEADAVVGGFADADFGGANRKGHRLSFYYNLTPCVVVGVNAFFTEVISGPRSDETRGRIQTDVIWKF